MISKFAIGSLFLASIATAQAPFANLFWEANDGGGWTRNALTTTNRTVQIRLIAEWGGGDAYGFGVTAFDAVIDAAHGTDNATHIARIPPFTYNVPTDNVVAMRQGNIIKLDDLADVAAPGAGPGWVFVGQSTGQFGTPIDPVNPANIFRFDLELGEVAGTRRVSSIHMFRFGGNAGLHRENGSQIFLTAQISGVDVTYVPSAPSVAIVAAGLVATRRQRRSIGSLQSVI